MLKSKLNFDIYFFLVSFFSHSIKEFTRMHRDANRVMLGYIIITGIIIT